MNDKELKKLLTYCQSGGRICPNPNYWGSMYQRLKLDKSFIHGRVPPSPLILGGWQASDEEKRLRFLTQIYWAYKHNLLESITRYLERLDSQKWYILSWHDDSSQLELSHGYISLDKIKEEYKRWETL